MLTIPEVYQKLLLLGGPTIKDLQAWLLEQGYPCNLHTLANWRDGVQVAFQRKSQEKIAAILKVPVSEIPLVPVHDFRKPKPKKPPTDIPLHMLFLGSTRNHPGVGRLK